MNRPSKLATPLRGSSALRKALAAETLDEECANLQDVKCLRPRTATLAATNREAPAVALLRTACSAVQWTPPETASFDDLAEWLSERCGQIRNRDSRKKAERAARAALEAARSSDETKCRHFLIKAALWHLIGHGPFSLQRKENQDLSLDEARVLGLLAAVRVHGEHLLPPAPPVRDLDGSILLEGEPSREVPHGRWVAALWRGRVHEPLIPLASATWTSANVSMPRPPDSDRMPAVLWWPDGGGESLSHDRVTRAVRSILLMEALSAMAASATLARAVRDQLHEARRSGWRSRPGRSALAKATALLRRHFAACARESRDALAKLEAPPERIRTLPPEEASARAWPYLEAIKTLSRRLETQQDPLIAGLNEWLKRASTSESELEELYAWLRPATIRMPRANTNVAVHLRHAFSIDHWSESSAARLWYRSQHAPDADREREVVQQVDDTLRRRAVRKR